MNNVNNNLTPKGPVLRQSLRANAEPFTPSGYHGSQPTISRRHSQNPTYVHTTPRKRNSVHGQMRRQSNQVHDQNNPPPQHQPQVLEKQKATTFSHDAFAKKGAAKSAAKAYAARKRAQMDKTNMPEQVRKADARKGFERRQSLKLAKKAAAERMAQENSGKIRETTSTADITEQTEPLPTNNLIESVVEHAIDLNQNEVSTKSTVSSVPSSRPNSTGSVPDADSKSLQTANTVNESIAVERQLKKTEVSTSTTTTATPPSSVTAPAAEPLSIETIRSTAISPPQGMAPRSTPILASTDRGNRNSLSTLPSMSVDIGSMSRNVMSSCTMSTVSGDSYGTASVKKSRETAMPSSGKWCDECAGVGLHIAAMMSTISSWRAEEERRSSNTSTSGNCSNSNKKGGWTRRVSQTFIGTSTSTSKNTSDVQKDKQRLQQQVDVLQLTVNFLYDKLQHHNAVTPEIAAMVRRFA